MCSIQTVGDWGPFASGLRCGSLTLTLLFQEVVMGISPAACALLLALVRIAFLVRGPNSTNRTSGYVLKLATLAVVAALQLAYVCVVATKSVPRTRASLATAVVCMASTVVFICLSELEHTRSPRPSHILTSFFFLSFLLDIIRARTLWMITDATLAAGLFTATLIMRGLVLVLESSPKTHALKAEYKDAPPESTNGIFSLFLLWWLNPLLGLGYRQDLSLQSLLRLGNNMSPRILLKETSRQWALARQETQHSLFLSLIRQHKRTVLGGALIRLCLSAFTFSQPFLVHALLEYVRKGPSGTSTEGMWLIIAYGAVYTGIAICQAGYMYQTERLIVMIRGGLISMLYRDVLNMDTVEPSKSSPVALISMDMDKIALGLQTLHQTWAGLLEFAVAIWLLQRQSLAVLGSVLMSLACILARAYVAGLGGGRQARWMIASQRRVDVTTTLLGRFTSVRLAGYADILSAQVSKLRNQEVEISKHFRKCLVAMVTLSYSSNIAAPILGLGVYALTPSIRGSATFDSTIAFSSLSIFTLLGQATTTSIQAALGLASAVSCIERFRQNFPIAWHDSRVALQPFIASPDNNYPPDPHLDKRNSSTRFKVPWSGSAGEQRGGSVKHGRMGLSEVQRGEGNEPAPPMDAYELSAIDPTRRSTSEMDACIVAQDLTLGWPEHEDVIRGLSCRIMRSRFTAVTGGTGQTPWLVNQSIRQNILGTNSYESGWYSTVLKACELEQDVQNMSDGDLSVIGSDGVRLSGGQRKRLALARAVYSRLNVLIMDDVLSGLDPQTTHKILMHLLGRDGLLRSSNRTVIMATVNNSALSLADDIINLDQVSVLTDQTVPARASISRNPGPAQTEPVSPRGLSADDEHERLDTADDEGVTTFRLHEEQLSLARGDRNGTDKKVYGYYISQIGLANFLLFLTCCVGQVLGFYIPQIWIALWTETNESGSEVFGAATFIGVYAMFGAFALLSLILGGMLLLLRIVPKTALSLHHALLSAVERAPVSFVVGKDVGEIVNRFSQDLMIVDTDVPIAGFMTVFACLSCIVQAIFLCISAPYIAAGVPIFLGTFYMIQRFYLKTSRQLRVLDIEAKAPLISHFLGTMRGLTTIRAYGSGPAFEQRFLEMLDLSQRPFYLMYCIQIWLGLVIEMCVAAVAVVLVGITVGVRNSHTAQFLGVSLLSIVSFAVNLDDLVRNWTSLETAIQAIYRIQSFSSTTPSEERPGKDHIPPYEWPNESQIEFRNVTAAYDSRPVLHDMTFTIRGSQKIGICGRTGGGKSSLLAVLSRILDLRQGSIWIDGVDTATIPRQLLRSKVLNVPQEPFVIPGSIRDNIDPLGTLADDDLVAILKDVRLWDTVKGGEEDIRDRREKLEVDAKKMAFSAGQLQLLSLARAMVQRGKIIVMDEVASNLDAETDELIRQIIRDKFRHHTVILVSHSAENLLDCDEVLAIDQGRVVEFDKPRNLAAQPGSKFNQMFLNSGQEPYKPVQTKAQAIEFERVLQE